MAKTGTHLNSQRISQNLAILPLYHTLPWAYQGAARISPHPKMRHYPFIASLDSPAPGHVVSAESFWSRIF